MSGLLDNVLGIKPEKKHKLTPALKEEVRQLWCDVNVAILGAGQSNVTAHWATQQADAVVKAYKERFGEEVK